MTILDNIKARGANRMLTEIVFCRKLKFTNFLSQYLRQKSRRFSMNPADFRSLENPVVD